MERFTLKQTHALLDVLESKDWRELLEEMIVLYGYDENTEELEAQ